MNKLVDFIFRPTRREYDPKKELGPKFFSIDGTDYGSRFDFEVTNRRNKVLKCSLFHRNCHYGTQQYPLMVYCHGNSANRNFSFEIVYKMLKSNISILAFDFAGCGNSEGKYVFQGLFEQFDIEDVLNYALEKFPFIDPNKIGLWGRCMGAVAALLLASRNSSISLIVLDSPFKDFSGLLKEYINKLKILSMCFGKCLYNKARKRALNKAGFDVEDLKPIDCIKTCNVPAFFIHATGDMIVPAHHTKELYEAYVGEKEFIKVKGGHNSKRTPEMYEAVCKFMEKAFERRNVMAKYLEGKTECEDFSPKLDTTQALITNKGI